MAYDFVDEVGFRTVVWVLDVSEVLGGAKVLKGKRVQEFPLTENTVGRLYAEPSAA